MLKAFVEKPDPARAKVLFESPGVAWNAGIFMARRRAFRAVLERYTDLVAKLGGRAGSAADLRVAYEGIEAPSIDYAVMEPAAADGEVVMAAMDVGWSDVGSWSALVHAIAGNYTGDARVVPEGESVDVGAADVVVRRTDDGQLALDGGPVRLSSPRPMALLPGARQHADVLEQMLARVNAWSREPVAVEVSR